MPDLPEPNDGTSIAPAPSQEAQLGSTMENGAPAPSDRNSLTLGPDGPILLHDVHFLNQMAHFNRERVPGAQRARQGHRGLRRLRDHRGRLAPTPGRRSSSPGVQTEMLARFSTVAGEQGCPDTWRDLRGFALKFYTSEGNYDLVGNNTPIFFVRDPMKFPHFIRSQKRLPDSGLRDNNMQWDFWTLNPESAHQVTYLMGDRGIPRTWRHMNGYGSHTYLWINAAGEKHWVKYHFHSDQGVEGLTDADATRIAGEDADFHRRDLYESIARQDFPSWTLSVQLMPYDDAKTYRINPFDLTKIWPHSDYPLVKVGTMTLNRNPENFFAEIEQAAFAPSAIVPGIGFSPDKMLLGRAFAYADTHRYRIGPNYHQLPVNRPGTGSTPTRRTGRWPTTTGATTRSTPRTPSAAATPTRSARSPTAGRPTARWCARPTRCAPTTTTGPRPARWCGRSGPTSSATSSCRPSPATSSPVWRATSWSGPSPTGGTSTPRPASGSRSRCARSPRATCPSGQPDAARADAGDPVVERDTHAER